MYLHASRACPPRCWPPLLVRRPRCSSLSRSTGSCLAEKDAFHPHPSVSQHPPSALPPPQEAAAAAAAARAGRLGQQGRGERVHGAVPRADAGPGGQPPHGGEACLLCQAVLRCYMSFFCFVAHSLAVHARLRTVACRSVVGPCASGVHACTSGAAGLPCNAASWQPLRCGRASHQRCLPLPAGRPCFPPPPTTTLPSSPRSASRGTCCREWAGSWLRALSCPCVVWDGVAISMPGHTPGAPRLLTCTTHLQ